ncbi:hypothetical protein [Rhodopirellula europaea]|uniref:Uncharacterized protein n=1 Tax=Rhodopirellula europaea 6C TaxID=1263867 RepID=M2B1R4_9BACT|nr:hypothetical protein [Rhodopirellula europaea]EMB16154.1 hypothetical protein RE6C_03114 [Rhodopirellula europaea 6C]
MNVGLRDLVSGVVGVENTDGFPLESTPPQGQVIVEFGTGAKTKIGANMDEFEKAKNAVAGKRATVTPQTTPAKAFKHYLQAAHNVMVDEATAGDILATAKSA